MTDTKWGKALTGPEIEALYLPTGTVYFRKEGDVSVTCEMQDHTTFDEWGKIWLIANHPAYTVHETNKRTGSRFVFHAGGPKPAGEIVWVLFRDGHICHFHGTEYWDWRTDHPGADIIGYELAEVKAEPTRSDIAANQKAVVNNLKKSGLIGGTGVPDTVTIKRMTEATARRLMSTQGFFKNYHYEIGMRLLKDLRLIREETPEEHFTRETGHAVTPAVAAALNWGR